MKISEYDILDDAFERSFGFMLNRIADLWVDCPDFHADPGMVELARDRCFSEFIIALEERGVELEEVKASKDDRTNS